MEFPKPYPPPRPTSLPGAELPKRWDWPQPPFPCGQRPSLSAGAAEPCRVEAEGRDPKEGVLESMDPSVGVLSVRSGAKLETIPFSRLRSITLTTPLEPAPRPNGPSTPAKAAQLPEEREYRLKSVVPGQGPMVGRTLGYVRAREGLYLFPPCGRGGSVRRVFVPHSAFSDHQFGPFSDDVPGGREISDPGELLEAIERQQRMPVLPIGASLLALGLVTQAQLDLALTRQSQSVPLGQMLVASGVLSPSGLETALAHKMGYPLVDLRHFPIDPKALRLLTLRSAIAMRIVPVLVDGARLVVAVSKVSRANKLRYLPSSFKGGLVPVLAPKSRILETLTRMSEHQTWDGVPLAMRFFQTTG